MEDDWEDDIPRYPPTGRPLAEPPIFNYEEFVVENNIPSDARLYRLFKKDIAMGYRYRDVLTERGLQGTYHGWTIDLYELEEDEERKAFYHGLNKEILIDFHATENAHARLVKALKAGIVFELGFWEYQCLDENGGTTRIRKEFNERNFYDKTKKQFLPTTEEAHSDFDTATSSATIRDAVRIASPSNPGDETSAEQRLAIENAALKKRIAELELENESAKRQKPEQ